jgi:hypothetical protein
MEIKKFRKFNEAVVIPTLDVTIDKDGNLYNGLCGFPTMKGNIEQEKYNYFDQNDIKREGTRIKRIVRIDGLDCPAGIDKNGKLICLYSKNGLVLDKAENQGGTPIKIPNEIIDKYKLKFRFWRTTNSNGIEEDYTFLLPSEPTGWVNVKIDMEVLKRVRRYSKNLGTNSRGYLSFVSKLDELETISRRTSTRGASLRKRNAIQKEMSAIILLHYINEIKDFFTPGSSGFLFESFLAGLIPNSKVVEDNSEVDIRADNKNYQVKLYSPLQNYVGVNSIIVDYYLVCLKYPDRIDIFLLDGSEIIEGVDPSENHVSRFSVASGIKTKQITTSPVFNGPGQVFKYSLELINLEKKIETIGVGLRKSLDDLYKELSEFQYNVETIITGVNEKGKIITGEEFSKVSDASKTNVEEMKKHLDNLLTSINRKEDYGQLSLF